MTQAEMEILEFPGEVIGDDFLPSLLAKAVGLEVLEYALSRSTQARKDHGPMGPFIEEMQSSSEDEIFMASFSDVKNEPNVDMYASVEVLRDIYDFDDEQSTTDYNALELYGFKDLQELSVGQTREKLLNWPWPRVNYRGEKFSPNDLIARLTHSLSMLGEGWAVRIKDNNFDGSPAGTGEQLVEVFIYLKADHPLNAWVDKLARQVFWARMTVYKPV